MEKTHCKNGHELTEDNSYIRYGRRECRACKNLTAKSFRKRHKVRVNEWHQENYSKNSARIIEYKKKYRSEGRHKDAQFNLQIPYKTMYEAQNGVCAICEKPEESNRSLAVDHDHTCCPAGTSCGKCVRELLCIKCNTALGLVDDSQELLMKLVKYLQKHSADKAVSGGLL